jgi:hypothetical protein
MPTKTQAKTAIDNATTSVKSDIDNILPVGVNIKDGSLGFQPMQYNIVLDAGNSVATADSWRSTIKTNFTNAGRTFTETLLRRESDGQKTYLIAEIKLTVTILNF